MNIKTLLIVLLVAVGAIAILGYKVISSPDSNQSDSNGGTTISLATNPDPLKTGAATFLIDVKDKNGKSVDNAKVTIDLNMTTMNMGTQHGEATPQGNGRYAVGGNISMGGPWRVSTIVKMPDGGSQSKDFTLDVR